MFNPINDTLEHIRRTYIPLLGMLVSAYNESRGTKYYVESAVYDSQYVGCVDMSEERFEEELAQLGFERNPLASLKTRAGTSEVEEGSFRWVPNSPTKLNTDYQLHCVIYDGSLIPDANTGETYVYTHWEKRWDREPMAHYNSEDFQPKLGRNMMRSKLEVNGIEYDDTRPPRSVG
jgi:hypothetical protein